MAYSENTHRLSLRGVEEALVNIRDASPFSMNGRSRVRVPGSWRSPFR
ncbi:MAG TPA: hypothetical protein VN372_13165 [Methanospirillum sp.]|nr:hypothetical protein [Methanospirillum sp.]